MEKLLEILLYILPFIINWVLNTETVTKIILFKLKIKYLIGFKHATVLPDRNATYMPNQKETQKKSIRERYELIVNIITILIIVGLILII